MIDQTVAAAIISALGTLGATVAFQRLMSPPRSQPPHQPCSRGAPESAGTFASPRRPSPRRACAGTTVLDSGDRGPRRVVSEPATRVWYGAQYQVNDFVSAMIASEGGCDRWRDRAIIHAYRAWAREGHIDPVPDTVLLSLLARHPHVRRTRDRLKDAQGRVMKLASGTPMRGVFYTISARSYAVVPDGVAMPRKAGVRAQPRKAPRPEAAARVRKGPGRVQGQPVPPERIAA